ncbi:IS66 family insertion sequence element accessory protein TnpA [Vibrio sp. EA2]|uniref:IS66 family insertion sequence element accessory protein TnpA n=1 Tax=Vibrio sp. EA2 TaxID=3079860 RepID=UPI002948DDE2|nr:IS66 family insertion sequence element accessory protein TnpB [Vibrio sp. EA2]MDV6254380.1 IS66 family insertion sequence element accessory protein TnpB [Vibrio sp. EA2]
MSSLQQAWQHHFEAWQTTNLSQAQYCRTHDLDQSQFSYWKRKFTRTNSVTKSVTSKFALAQVETVTEHVSSSLTVTLPNGTQVEGIDERNAHVAAKLIECMS